MKKLVRILPAICVSFVFFAAAMRAEEPPKAPPRLDLKTRNILLVTSDGLRWQEVFGGADSSLLDKPSGGVPYPVLMKNDFGGDKPEARRKRLMPFFWSVIARQGQMFGNAGAGSEVRVTNGRNFSYP